MTPPDAALGIRARGVRRTFAGGIRAVDGIDLDVEPGEFLALLGPSGCGKSTLLRMLAGLDQPDAGTIELSGGAARGALAFVFQDAHLLPWRNVLDNVALPLELAGISPDERHARARRAIEDVGLSDASARYPAELSGGMRMRASLARAVVTRPRLLLLDEPFAALDEITRQRLDDQLRSLHASMSMTIVFVTHSTAEAAYLADRAIVFSSRPASILLDHVIELPRERSPVTRTQFAFAEELGALARALERSGA